MVVNWDREFADERDGFNGIHYQGRMFKHKEKKDAVPSK